MKPSDFLIGIRDLFMFLVPGAVFLLLVDPQQELFVDLENRVGGLGLFVFAVIAYGLGSFASAVGALLDPVADFIMRDAHRQYRRLAEAFEEAIIREATGQQAIAERPWSAKGFWWEQIRLHCPVGIAELDRLESIQKLFRALTVVFLVHAILILFLGDQLPQADWQEGAVRIRRLEINLVAAFATFMLYVHNRRKFAYTIYRLTFALSITPDTIAGARPAFGKRAAEIFAEDEAAKKMAPRTPVA